MGSATNLADEKSFSNLVEKETSRVKNTQEAGSDD